MRAATSVPGGGSGWRLYDYVARNFIASLMPPLRYKEHVCELHVGGGGGKDGSGGTHTFTYTWHTIVDQGKPTRSNFRIHSL